MVNVAETSSLVEKVLGVLDREGVVLAIEGVAKSEIPKRLVVNHKRNNSRDEYEVMPANDADTLLPILDVDCMYDPGSIRQTVIRPDPKKTEVFALSAHYSIFYRKP